MEAELWRLDHLSLLGWSAYQVLTAWRLRMQNGKWCPSFAIVMDLQFCCYPTYVKGGLLKNYDAQIRQGHAMDTSGT